MKVSFVIPCYNSSKTIKNVVNEIEYKNCYIGRWGNTEELIACADGMITFFSTTAIEKIRRSKC